MDLAQIIAANWAALMEAPVLFLAAVLGGYVMARLHYNRQIETLRDQANLWKDRFDGASADQVKARLDALETAVRGRRLSRDQISKIAIAAAYSGAVERLMVIHCLNGCQDAPRYGGDLERAFTEAGWRVNLHNLISGNVQPGAPSGLALSVKSLAMPSDLDTAAMNALRAASVPLSSAMRVAEIPRAI